MVTSGNLNKVDGDIFYAADVTALVNGMGKVFANTSLNLMENQRDGFSFPGSSLLTNVVFDNFASDVSRAYQNIRVVTGSFVTQDSLNTWSGTYYIDVIADSMSTFNGTNNCSGMQVGKDMDGKNIFRVWCYTGTDNVKKAQVVKTLFYGTNGGDHKIGNFSGYTKFQSSDANDVGRRAWTEKFTGTDGGTGNIINGSLVGTFANTTTNSNMEVWTFVTAGGASANTERAEVSFLGSTVNTVTDSTSDETGTDTTAEKQTNPSVVTLLVSGTDAGGGSTNSATIYAVMLTSGTISFSERDPDSKFTFTGSDYGVSGTFTQAGSSFDSFIISQNFVTPGSIGNVIPCIFSTLPSTMSGALFVSNNSGTTFTSVNSTKTTALASTGSEFCFRYYITRTGGDIGSVYPIFGYSALYNLY